MTTLFIIFQIILVILITITVLLQKSSSIGLGAYSGSNESLFGAKGPAGFLAKFTFFLGVLLIANTITLSYMYNTAGKDSVAEKIVAPSAPDINATNSAPSVPNVAPSVPNATSQAPSENTPSLAPTAPQTPNSVPNSANGVQNSGANSAEQNATQN